MKNRFIRFAIVVFLSSMGAMSLAGTNPNLPNPAGSKQGFGFLETVGAVMDPALSDPYVSQSAKEAAVKRLSDSYNSIQGKRSVVDAALKRSSEPLKIPKCGLVSNADIKNYPLVDKYLTLDDPEISYYFILQENYAFDGLDGSRNVIPAGFIWDGASIPKDFRVTLPIVEIEMKIPNVLLEVGNTRYSSAISEGLVHDWMYRNPMKYSKEDADLLFYVNAVRCKNPNPLKMYEAVNLKGFDAYNGHVENVKKGFYDEFSAEFYDRNTTIYQSCQTSHAPKEDQSAEKVRHDEKNVCVADKIPDLTNLIDLMNQAIEYLRKIDAMGQKPSEQDRVAYNELVGRIGKEFMKNSKEFDEYSKRMNLTLTQKEQLSKKFEETIKPYLETMMTLMQQIEAKGYWHFTLDGSLGSSTESQ